jgi:kumamolisin
MNPTSNIPLMGSDRKPPKGKYSGPADPNEQIEISVYVRPRTSVAETLRMQQAGKRGRLTRQEYTSLHGALPEDIARVEAFANENGLKVLSSDVTRRRVKLSGTVAAMSRAFGIELGKYEQEGKIFRGRVGPINVPANLTAIIDSVLGLDNRPQADPRMRIRPYDEPGAVSYTPPQVAGLYSFPTDGIGSGQCIGLIELGGGFVQSDLDTYFSGLGLATPTVIPVPVDGANNSPAGDPNSADAEVVLDIEVSGAVAPGAKIAVYFAPNSDQGFVDAITTAVFDEANKPSVISISWGGPESSWSAQSIQAMDDALQSAAVVGITVCVASGDDGSSDGASGANVDFPASSPQALACGGTSLRESQGVITSETVWNNEIGATGGGVSAVFGLPPWQTGANVPPSANPGGGIGRGVPDVSAVADPVTGYSIFVDGQSVQIGGTSAAAPLWAGLIALINEQVVEPVGFISPRLYKVWINEADVTQDITNGNNGAYSAVPGWDACTGWGSPNGEDLLAAVVY